MYSKEWTEGHYTKEDIDHVGTILINLINKNGGSFQGTIADIARECGYTVNNGKVENYGSLFCCLQEVKKQYNIKCITKGRAGNLYSINMDLEKNKLIRIIEINNIYKLNSIQSLLRAIDLNKLDEDSALRVIKMIDSIINN